RVLTVSVIVSPLGQFGFEQSWENLTFHPSHRRSLERVFDPRPQNPLAYLRVPITFESPALRNGAAIADALLNQPNAFDATLVADNLDSPSDESRTLRVRLQGGS